jgi:hypothetical protein
MWVARERSPGDKFLFTPYSSAPGGVMTPTDSPIHTLADLDCRSLGVAGMLDPRIEGAQGEAEKQAFSRLPRSAVALAGEICRRTLMQILPGAAEGDFASFGEGVSRVQEIVGEHFAPVQGGG